MGNTKPREVFRILESPQCRYSSEIQRFLVRFEVLCGYMEPKRSDRTATVIPQAAFSECFPAFDVLSFRCSTDQTGNPMVIYHTTETIRWGRMWISLLSSGELTDDLVKKSMGD